MANNYNDNDSSPLFAMDKMKEMEEEMSRFEEEILGSADTGPSNQVEEGREEKTFPFPFPVNNHDRDASMSSPQERFAGPTGFPPQSMMQGNRHPGKRMPGPPGIRPPGMRMGGPSGIRMGGPPGQRPMRPHFIPHQVHRPPQMMAHGMPLPMLPMKPKTISAPPTVYSAKPVKFNVGDKKIEDKEKAVETQASVETKSVTHKPIESQQPVHERLMYQQAMMQQQQHLQHQVAMMAGSQEQTTAPAKKAKKKKFIRTAAGQNWEDESLLEWDANDFRIFCGDLGNEVNDDTLTKAFNRYPSFLKAKVVRDKRNGKSKGYGFVSFKDPNDFVQAMREMNGKYVGNRPIKLRKSMWKERNMETAKKKMKEKQRLGLR